MITLRISIIFAVLLFLIDASFAQNGSNFKKKKDGYNLFAGKNKVTRILFEEVSPFSDSVATVKYNNSYFLINTKGVFITEPEFIYLSRVKSGYALAVKLNEDTTKYGNKPYLYGLIGKNGLFGQQMFTSVGLIEDSTLEAVINKKLYRVFASGRMEFLEEIPQKDTKKTKLDTLTDTTNFVFAKFSGNENSLFEYLMRNIHYPKNALEENISGIVYLNFKITKTGKVTNRIVLKSVHPSIDMEALRLIWEMPDWIPAQKEGKPVDSTYNMPIKFLIQG